jgi:cytochrome c-type biogenesis protein
MEEFLNNLMSISSLPVVSAFALGLMTAISPCPLATNITAIGFISKEVEYKKRVFFNGVIYTVGRAFSYTLLAFIILIGADQFQISGFFQRYGEKFLGPLLLFIGILMLGIITIKFPGFNKLSEKFQTKKSYSYWSVFLLGILFALAFCPYSGVLYFGLLIPLTIKTASGLYLPMVFAIATGIPVIVFAWLLAYTISGLGRLYNRLKKIDYWFRRVVAVMFIGVGLYYTIIIWI